MGTLQPARLFGVRLVMLFGALLMLPAVFMPHVSAHAFPKLSTPAENSVVTQSPSEILIGYTEPIEPRYSSAQLFDADGGKIATLAAHVGSDPTVLVLPLPDRLPAGTYTVQWKNISAADGHPNAGYFAFTVGSQANVDDQQRDQDLLQID